MFASSLAYFFTTKGSKSSIMCIIQRLVILLYIKREDEHQLGFFPSSLEDNRVDSSPQKADFSLCLYS